MLYPSSISPPHYTPTSFTSTVSPERYVWHLKYPMKSWAKGEYTSDQKVPKVTINASLHMLVFILIRGMMQNPIPKKIDHPWLFLLPRLSSIFEKCLSSDSMRKMPLFLDRKMPNLPKWIDWFDPNEIYSRNCIIQ